MCNDCINDTRFYSEEIDSENRLFIVIKTDLLAPQNRSYILLSVVIMPTLINIIIASALANIMFSAGEPIMLWGPESMVIDLAISSLLTPLITGLIAYYSTVFACRAGTLYLSENIYWTDIRHFFAKHPLSSTLLISIAALLINCCLLAIFSVLYHENTVSWYAFLAAKTLHASILSLIGAIAGTWFAIDHHTHHGETLS